MDRSYDIIISKFRVVKHVDNIDKKINDIKESEDIFLKSQKINIEKEELDRITVLYERNKDNEDIIENYVHVLYNFSLRSPIEDCLDYKNKIEQIYKKNKLKNVAICLGRLILNISHEMYLLKELNESNILFLINESEIIENLYNENNCDELAEPLTKIWLLISLTPQYKKLYEEKIINLCYKNNYTYAKEAMAKIIFYSEKIED